MTNSSNSHLKYLLTLFYPLRPSEISDSNPPVSGSEQPSVVEGDFSRVYPQCYLKDKRLVYIMNHFEYDTHKQKINDTISEYVPTKRFGSLKDVETLKTTLGKFNVTIKERPDQTKENILKMAEDEAKTDYSGFDFVMYIIMTHGSHNKILTARDAEYNLETDFINVTLKNKQLIGVPKVFIIQACRGHKETDSKPFVPPPQGPNDILKLFSTYEGFVSIRDSYNGTVFIQELCSKLTEFGTTEDLMRIMQRVTEEVNK